MILYHLSPNLFTRLSVKRSKGAKKRVWLCKFDNLLNLANHLYAHHGERMRYLYIFWVFPEDVTKFRDGIYHSYKDLLPIAYYKVKHQSQSTFEIIVGGRSLVN